MIKCAEPQGVVSFFPTPLPDELLDSVVYRYHWLSGNLYPRDTVQALYGMIVPKAPKLLVNQISALQSRLPQSYFATADDLMNGLTMVPAFGAVTDQGRMRCLRSASLRGRPLGQNAHYRKITRVMHDALHCCPMCVHEETNRLGVAYWHRSHQLDGVEVCHKHGCNLISACPYCHEPISPPGSMKLPSSRCSACRKPFLAVLSSTEPLLEIARLGHQALSGVVPFCDRHWFGNRVMRVVGSDTKRVCDEIRELFGDDYLDDDVSGSYYIFDGDWLALHLRKIYKTRGADCWSLNLPSMKHMMVLVHFLFGSWDQVVPPAELTRQAA